MLARNVAQPATATRLRVALFVMATYPHNLILRLGLKAFGGAEFGGYAPLPAPTAEVRTDSRRMRVYGRCTSEKVDRSREIVVADGVDWDEYRNNPICTINHGWREPEKLIGHAVIDRHFTPKKAADGRGWDFGCQFIQHGPQAGRAAEAFALVDTGVLRGVSLGFRFLGAHSQQITAPDGQPALRIDRCTPFEITFLPVPDNPDAVVHVVEKGVNGRRLSQPWMDILRPMVPKVKMHGFTLPRREKAMAGQPSAAQPKSWQAKSTPLNGSHTTDHTPSDGQLHPSGRLYVSHSPEGSLNQVPFGQQMQPPAKRARAHQTVALHASNVEPGKPHHFQLDVDYTGKTRLETVTNGPDGQESQTHEVPPASRELRVMIANHHKTHAWMPLLDKIHEEYPEHTAHAIQAHTESRQQHGTRTKGMKPMAQPMPDPAAQQGDPAQMQPQQPPSPASQLPQVKPSIALLMATEQYAMGFIKFLKQQGDVQDHPEVKKLIGGLILHLSQAYRALSATHQKIQSEDPTFPNLLGHGGILAPDPTPPGLAGAGAQPPAFNDGLDDVNGMEINQGIDGMQGADQMPGADTDPNDDQGGILSEEELAGGPTDDPMNDPTAGPMGADYGDAGDEDQMPDQSGGVFGEDDDDDQDQDDAAMPMKKRQKGYEVRPDQIVLVREKGLPIAFERARRLLESYEQAFQREFSATDLNVLRFVADNLDVMKPKQKADFKAWCREKSLQGITRKPVPPPMGSPEYLAEVEREIARLQAEKQHKAG